MVLGININLSCVIFSCSDKDSYSAIETMTVNYIHCKCIKRYNMESQPVTSFRAKDIHAMADTITTLMLSTTLFLNDQFIDYILCRVVIVHHFFTY